MKIPNSKFLSLRNVDSFAIPGNALMLLGWNINAASINMQCVGQTAPPPTQELWFPPTWLEELPTLPSEWAFITKLHGTYYENTSV